MFISAGEANQVANALIKKVLPLPFDLINFENVSYFTMQHFFNCNGRVSTTYSVRDNFYLSCFVFIFDKYFFIFLVKIVYFSGSSMDRNRGIKKVNKIYKK